jgi:hypothetical protein
MRRKSYLLLCLLGIYSITLAQNKQVTGLVLKSSNNEPLAGATVALKGGNATTVTNQQGRYAINVPGSNAVLVFSYVEHKPVEISVGNKTVKDVSLEEDVSALNDVVVVGYSTVRRRDLTGSVSSVNAKQLKDIPLSNAAEALTGKLAGVEVTTTGETSRALKRLNGMALFISLVPLLPPLPAFHATNAPFGWRQINWREDLLRTNNVLNVGATNAHYIDAIGYLFAPNKSELYPFDQATLDSYQGKLKQNPNY